MTSPPPASITLTITVQAPMADWLRAQAAAKNVSMATIVRDIMVEVVPKDVKDACRPWQPRKMPKNMPGGATEAEDATPAPPPKPTAEFLVQTFSPRIRELADKGHGQTKIAAMLRLPYAVVGAALILTSKGSTPCP